MERKMGREEWTPNGGEMSQARWGEPPVYDNFTTE